jgi:L-ribulose-5-phosphate 3-epimerase
MLPRREFLKLGAAGLAAAALACRPTAAEEAGMAKKIRIGARHFGGDFEAGKRAGMDGLEIGVGGPADKLQIADPALRRKYKDGAKATGLAVSSLSMDLMNPHPLFSEPRAPAWVAQTIEAAQDLGAKAILVPFFGPADLQRDGEVKKTEYEALIGRLKELAPKAKEAGVALGIESYLSAKQNLELLDRVGSEGVAIYYDVCNLTDKHYDVAAELRALKGRICMIHFKDENCYLGEPKGKVKMEPIGEAIRETGYQGWIVLETPCPSKNAEADCRRNAEYSRKLLGI